MNLGETILHLRTGRGMSQEDLADALEVSRQSVSKWETGASVPDLDKLIKLSALFGVTLDELVLGEKREDPPPEPSAPPLEELPAALPEEPPAPPRAASAVQRIAGWILVGFAAAAWLVLMALGQSPLGLLVAPLPLACGMVCLIARRNTGLWCAWVLLGCLDLFLQFAVRINWGMILLPQVYGMEGMQVRLACAWGQALFTAALILFTAARFRERPVVWTRGRRVLFITGVIALIFLYRSPYLTLLFLANGTASQLLNVLLRWARLALLTALLTTLAQGIWRKPEA